MLQTVVALFVKPPVPGKVKTRLARDIGNNASCAVYRHLADEIIRQVRASALPLVIFFDGTDPEKLPAAWRTAARQCLPQQGNDLGERMAYAFTLLFKEGFTQAMLLGSDIFGIDATYLHAAIDLLADHDMVISPALDGGYCLIGFHHEQFSATLFENIPWSSDQVFQLTMKSAENLKLSAGVLPPLQDIDTCDDLQAVCEQTAVTDALTDLRNLLCHTADRETIMSQLFSPFSLRSITLKNRVALSPMCQYSCTDGLPNDWHRVHYGSRAVGGAGLIMVEATAVSPEGRISPLDCGIWNDAQAQAFQPITRFIKEQGAIPALQLAHAGRKASTAHPSTGGGPLPREKGGWQPLAPSPLPFAPDYPVPAELTTADLFKIEADFVAATRRAKAAGFEIVELHMAHGYLLHEFLSPLTNHRTDNYGGNLENRMRFPLRIAQAVRQAWPAELPLFTRISATDWVEGGWDLEQSLELCRCLKKLGIDLIDCSSGGLVPDAVIPVAPGFQVPFAAAIKAEAGIATAAVGLITEATQAEEILEKGGADLVVLGRELLRSPFWSLAAAKELGSDISWPTQYLRAR